MHTIRYFFLLAVAVFMCTRAIAGGLLNPDFDPNLKHWKTRGKVYAHEGKAKIIPSITLPGNPTLITASLSQDFDGAGSGDAYVRFTYQLRTANAQALVELSGGGNVRNYLLPYNGGLPQTAQVMLPGCHAGSKIEFVVFGQAGQVAFEVDQVTDTCSNQPWANAVLLSPLPALDPAVQVVAALPLSRYTHENFDSIQVSPGIAYGENITVLTGQPVLDTLWADVYAPANDTLAARPLVVLAHSGDFLPATLNSRTSGSRSDSSIVAIATRLSQRGYVVAAIDYRLGWSPVSASQSIRAETFLRALYLGIQDARTAIRYFKMEASVWGIDTQRVAIGGLGTGGYLAYGAASLDDFSEMAALTSLDSALWGNIWATNNRPLCVANHPGYGSLPQMAFAAGGAVPSLDWIDAGEPPLVGLHSERDAWVPYGFGALVVPTSGEFVINVEGSGRVIPAADSLGNQAVWIGKDLAGPMTDRAHAIHGGIAGLFPFQSDVPLTEPWEWWDSTHVNHAFCIGLNPQMSPAFAAAYIDTIIHYLSPRMICALDLDPCQNALTGIPPEAAAYDLRVYPNPSAGDLVIEATAGDFLQEICLYQLDGKEVAREKDLHHGRWVLARQGWPAGLYVLWARTEAGVAVRKVVFQPMH